MEFIFAGSLLHHIHELWEFPFDHAVSVFWFRESPMPYILNISLQGFQGLFAEVCIFLYKFRCKGLENSKNITHDHELTVCFNPCPDAIDGNTQFISNDFTDFGWDRFH